MLTGHNTGIKQKDKGNGLKLRGSKLITVIMPVSGANMLFPFYLDAGYKILVIFYRPLHFLCCCSVHTLHVASDSLVSPCSWPLTPCSTWDTLVVTGPVHVPIFCPTHSYIDQISLHREWWVCGVTFPWDEFWVMKGSKEEKTRKLIISPSPAVDYSKIPARSF